MFRGGNSPPPFDSATSRPSGDTASAVIEYRRSGSGIFRIPVPSGWIEYTDEGPKTDPPAPRSAPRNQIGPLGRNAGTTVGPAGRAVPRKARYATNVAPTASTRARTAAKSRPRPLAGGRSTECVPRRGIRSGGSSRSRTCNRSLMSSSIVGLQQLSQAAAPPHEVHAHGGGCRAQDPGHLIDVAVRVVAKDDGSTLPRREPPEHGQHLRGRLVGPVLGLGELAASAAPALELGRGDAERHPP